MPEPMSMPEKASEGEKHYLSLYLDWESDYDLPDSGTITVKFRKVSENKSKNRDGKKSFSVSLDILEITAVSGKKSEAKDEDPGDHLDKLKKEVESEKEYDEDE